MVDAVPRATTPATSTSCCVCGTTVDGPPPLTWSTARAERGLTACCGTCTRQHLRALEAKLDEQHW